MDLNLTVLAGRVTAAPVTEVEATGVTRIKLLVTVRSDEPRRRIDVIPVTIWDPEDDSDVHVLVKGDNVWVAGAIQRRFWTADAGRTSVVEVVAHEVKRQVQTEEDSNA